jgi:predicted RNase H-like HicB family nuclease
MKVVCRLHQAYNDSTEVLIVEKQYEVSHPFRVILTLNPDDDGYVATVPSLPGCITDGKTIEDALTHAGEAISLYLDALQNKKESDNTIVLSEAFKFLLNEEDDVYDEKYGYLLKGEEGRDLPRSRSFL